jgi:hypothetical protein
VDDQYVGETAVIRFQCASQRIETFDGDLKGNEHINDGFHAEE